MSEDGARSPVAIQEEFARRGQGALRKYQDLVVGSRRIRDLVLFELIVTGVSWIPGAVGLVLRRALYPLLLGAVGRNVAFGCGTVLRHPAKIRIGDDVVVDDLVVLDAKGTSNRGIEIGRGGFIGRGTILSCKDGDIVLGDDINIGFHCEVFSGSSVRVGHHGLFAAYTYLVGGGHAFDDLGRAVVDQERTSKGIVLGDNVWLGAGATVLDGVEIGRDVVVGAGAVVTTNLPNGAIAVGVPARVVRLREPA